MGESSQPVKGYNTPAASGTPSALYKNAKARYCLMVATVSREMTHCHIRPSAHLDTVIGLHRLVLAAGASLIPSPATATMRPSC